MASFQSTVGLPPLSTIATANHGQAAVSSPDVAGASSLGSSAAVELRDARIKDPIPKKLKGRTNSLSGNFGVLQMELGGHESSLERDELAKRASESTELAAMRAYQSGHGVSSLKRFVRVPDDPNAWDPYYTPPAAVQAPAPSVSPAAAVQPLTPPDVKQEQARLLALLRGLPPASVVEQICKALSYFGGAPGAAPPPDGVFPRSELANGSGAAFVGWIAEIFPKLPNETTAAMKSIPQTNATGLLSLTADNPDEALSTGSAAPGGSSAETAGSASAAAAADGTALPAGKRRRGRPKGSKATKARSDKGVKKGSVKDRQALAAEGIATNPNTSSTRQEPKQGLRPAPIANGHHGDDSWVDVDDDHVLDVTGAGEDGLFFTGDTNASLAADGSLGSAMGAKQQATVSKTDDVSTADTGTATNAQPAGTGKRRGRPKGSKNRPKPPVEDAANPAPAAPAPATVTPIPPPTVPDSAVKATASSKKSKGKKAKAANAQNTEGAGQNIPAERANNRGQGTEQLELQTTFKLPGAATDPQHTSVSLAATAAPISAGNKRKRAKAPKHDNGTLVDSVSGHSSAGGLTTPVTGDDGHAGPQSDYPQGTFTPAKKQKKLSDTKASVQSNADGSASPVPDIAASTAAAGFGQTETSLDADASIMPSLDPDRGSQGEFSSAAAFDVLSTHLDQEASASLPEQQQHNHDHDLASLLNQQLPQQHQQSVQQQPLVAQKPISLTPPFRSADRMQSLGGTAQHQTQQQTHQPHLNQNAPSHHIQQIHPHQQVSVHGGPSASSQNNTQAQIATSLSSGSLTPQQLPRPNPLSQSFYAQNRPTSSNQFGQSLPQPLQQQQQQQQQNQTQPHKQQQHQQQQKQQFAPQYQPHGQYSSQPQQHHHQQQQQQTFASQQRLPSQNMGSSSPGLLSQASSHRSPQYAAPNTTTMRPGSGTYASNTPAGSMGFNSSVYDQGRRQNTTGSPALGHTYGTPGTPSHALSHQASPPFVGTRPQHSPSTLHTEGVGNVAQGIQAFHSFDSPSLFDGISLDTAGGSNGLGLTSPATYGLGGVPRASGSANAFGSSSSATFDSSMGGNMRDRFYGVRR